MSKHFPELKQIALANPRGKIVSCGATGSDVNNDGNWQGKDVSINIYMDVLEAAMRLSSKSDPQKLIGSSKTLLPLFEEDYYYRRPRWMFLLPIFWFSANRFVRCADIIEFDETADPGIVLLAGSDGDAVYIDTR